jgi:hypothetical protein
MDNIRIEVKAYANQKPTSKEAVLAEAQSTVSIKIGVISKPDKPIVLQPTK